MKANDYYKAYKFLKARATKGSFEALKVLHSCPSEQQNRIIAFLKYKHNVKFI